MLRFLKIITPVKCVIPLCERYIRQPKEGELHQRTHKGAAVKLNQPAWAVNIDNPKGTFVLTRIPTGRMIAWLGICLPTSLWNLSLFLSFTTSWCSWPFCSCLFGFIFYFLFHFIPLHNYFSSRIVRSDGVKVFWQSLIGRIHGHVASNTYYKVLQCFATTLLSCCFSFRHWGMFTYHYTPSCLLLIHSLVRFTRLGN